MVTKIADIDREVKMNRERSRFEAKRPQLWEARCLECDYITGYRSAGDAQTKAHAHAHAKKHDVELYAEVYVERVSWRTAR